MYKKVKIKYSKRTKGKQKNYKKIIVGEVNENVNGSKKLARANFSY